MAIFKRCNTCHQLFQGRNCPRCAARFDKKRKEQVEALSIYGKSAWKKCRQNVLIKYQGFDIWLLGIGVVKRIAGRVCVHHILERDERPDLIYDLDNLISVSVDSHAEIHAMYKCDKPAAIARINKGIAKFKEMIGNGG